MWSGRITYVCTTLLLLPKSRTRSLRRMGVGWRFINQFFKFLVLPSVFLIRLIFTPVAISITQVIDLHVFLPITFLAAFGIETQIRRTGCASVQAFSLSQTSTGSNEGSRYSVYCFALSFINTFIWARRRRVLMAVDGVMISTETCGKLMVSGDRSWGSWSLGFLRRGPLDGDCHSLRLGFSLILLSLPCVVFSF